MLSRWFLIADVLDTHGIHYHHDPLRVVLSYLVVVFAAYTALHLRECIQLAATPNARRIWLATASVSMGLGVWSMHFIAVLAMKMPMPVGYDLKITALSAGFSVLGSWIAFSLLESARSSRSALLAGPIFGTGVALMHYVGIAAMRMPARIYLDPWFFALSAVVAVGLSTVALYTLRDLQLMVKGHILWVRLAGSAMIGLAIALMHYTGMLATTFSPDPGSPPAGLVLDSSRMAAAVTAIAFLIVGLALAATRVDRNRNQAHRLTAALIDSMPGFFALLDPAGCFIRWNANLANLTGLGDGELRGLSASLIAVPGDRPAVDAKIREVFARGFGTLEFGVLNRNGDVRTVDWSGRKVLYQDRSCILAIGLDMEERHAAEARILESEDRFRTVFSAVNDGISVHDPDTAAFLEVNPRLCEMFGYTRDEMLALDLGDLSTGVPPYTRQDIAPKLQQVLRSEEGVTFEWHCKTKDQHLFWVEISVCRRMLGAKFVLVAIARDITERKRAQESLRVSDQQYRDLFESTRDAILVIEPSTARLTAGNPSAVKLFGAVDEHDLISRTPWDYSPELQPDGRGSQEKMRAMIEAAGRMGSHSFEWTHKRADGTEFPSDVLLTLVAHPHASVLYATVRDILERKQAEELIARMAHYDALTGLANRRVFVAALDQAISRARRKSEVFAVLYLDLDLFKDINDTLGHPAGDLLLRAVAERLKAGLREVDTVARFGGDEFAVILADLKDPAAVVDTPPRSSGITGKSLVQEGAALAGSLADAILKTLSIPYSIRGNEIRSSATIGIGVYGPDAPDAETILSQADLALYKAKAEGRGTYRFFTDAMDAEIRARLSLTQELSYAIDADQLFLMYQPQVDIETGLIVGLEGLVRWQHPSRGLLGPGKFIPLAESSGLIMPLGRWVIRQACRQIQQWLAAGIVPPAAAVNLSGVQFKRPQQLEEDIAGSLAEFHIPAWRLELELTESVLMAASRGHDDLLLRLRSKGHRLAIDDFGSGYSSLDYLRRFPADRIKIAQSFTSDIGRTSGGDAIVRAALALAQQLGMEVVVEGVETRAQLELLRTWGCRIVQGYYLSKPLDVAAVTALLRVGKISLAPAETVETSLQTLGARTRD